MKILHVINSLVRGGGAEALVLALATALNKIEGNVVHVLSLENPKDKEYAQLLEAQGVRCFVLSHQMRSFRNIQLLSDFIQEHDYDIINVWGIERSGFFNGREKWAKGFENQRV